MGKAEWNEYFLTHSMKTALLSTKMKVSQIKKNLPTNDSHDKLKKQCYHYYLILTSVTKKCTNKCKKVNKNKWMACWLERKK